MPDRVATMTRDRALVIDADEIFRQFLEERLGSVDVELVPIDGPEAIAADPTIVEGAAFVVIAVDHPDREGYRHFTEVRRDAPGVPIVLVTSTLSAEDFSLHAKLRTHADLYLDKRLLDGVDLDRALSTVAPDLFPEELEPEPEEGEEPAPAVDTTSDDRTRWLLRGVSSGGLDALTDALGDDEDDAESELSPAAFARLKAKVDQLRRRLADAERAARATPFSQEFSSLSDVVREQEAQLSHQKLEIGHRDSLVAEQSRKLEIAERRAAAAEQMRDDATMTCRQLDLRVERAEELASELQRSLEQKVEAHARELNERDTRHARIEDDLRERLERVSRDLTAIECTADRDRGLHQDALQELREAHARELASVHELHEVQLRSAKQELEARIGEIETGARTDLEARLAEIQRTHGQEIDALRESYESKLELERQGRVEEVETTRREGDQARRDAVEETRRELLAHIDELDRARDAALADATASHRSAMEELTGRHAVELAHRDREVESVREDVERRLAESALAHETALDELRRRHDEALAAKEAEHQRARAQMQRDANVQLELAIREAKGEAETRLEEVLTAHSSEIDARALELKEQIVRLEQQRDEEAERFARDLEQARLEVQEAERAAAAERLEREQSTHTQLLANLREEHADELARLRQSHEAALERQQCEIEELRGVRSEHGDLMNDHEQARSQLALYQSEAERLEQALDKAQADVAARNADLERAEAEAAQHRTLLERTQADVLARDAALERVEAEVATRDATLEHVQSELAAERASVEQLQSELQESNAALQQAHAELLARDAQVQPPDAEAMARLAEVDALSAELEQRRETMVSLVAVLEDLQGVIDGLAGESDAAESAATLLRSIVRSISEMESGGPASSA